MSASAQPEEVEIDVPGTRLAARVWGPAEGRPTLALHGWLDNAATFDRIAPLLPGLRLVCLDLPGHGRSQHGEPGHDYAFIDYVARAWEVADVLGWERFGLIGHSLGAAVATVAAGTMPQRVDRMALIEGLGPVVEQPQHAPERLRKALTDARTKHDRRAPVYASIEDAAARLQRSMSRMSRDAARVLCSRGLREVEGGVTWRSDPRLRWASRFRLSEAQVLAFIAEIECPTLLIRGTSGFPFAPRSDSPRVQALQRGSVVEIEGGHHLHLDAPQPVAAAIATFFDQAEVDRSPDG